MKRVKVRPGAILSIIVLLVSLYGCDTGNFPSGETWILEGKVTIGPICPVETDPPQPECQPTAETYLAYPVSIWSPNGRIWIRQINPALDGTYRTVLAEGRYLVRLETGDFGPGSSNLPAFVSINRGDTTIFDIDIDTGIR